MANWASVPITLTFNATYFRSCTLWRYHYTYMYVRPHTINTHIFVCHIFQIMPSDSTQPGSEGSQKEKEKNMKEHQILMKLHILRRCLLICLSSDTPSETKSKKEEGAYIGLLFLIEIK